MVVGAEELADLVIAVEGVENRLKPITKASCIRNVSKLALHFWGNWKVLREEMKDYSGAA